jgi:hypothetical protein
MYLNANLGNGNRQLTFILSITVYFLFTYVLIPATKRITAYPGSTTYE